MKNKVLTIMGVVISLSFLIGSLYFIENYHQEYYTRIDNSKVEILPTRDNMKYEYTLDCYNKNGSKKTLKFKTSKKLREKAYITLEVRTIGVHKWKEVQPRELPAKVKEKLK